jgi:DNA-binding CsgD family transcriptional regulator
MKKKDQQAGVTRKKSKKTPIEQATTRAELAEMRTELAETRTELAETRTELAEIRTEEVATRAEQAESTLQRLVHRVVDPLKEIPTLLLKAPPLHEVADQKSPLEQLTSRQREILRLIAEGQNTKQIAEILKISPKTVEYHRTKLMAALDVHDVPGLVRFAVRVGLVAPEN